jgi:MoaA/NifB/PqqE/SkfB family radical SAM enzyme
MLIWIVWGIPGTVCGIQVMPTMFAIYCNLVLTRRCNLRCKSCGVWKHPTQELSTGDMNAALDKMIRLKHPGVIGITGGEPLLRPDVYEIIDHISRQGVGVDINSNGTLSKERYQRLLDSQVGRIGISLGFLTPEKQDEFCGVAGTWDRVIANLKHLRANNNGKFVYVQNTLTGYNYKEVMRLKEFVNGELGLPFMLVPATWGKDCAQLRTANKELSKVDAAFEATKSELKRFLGMRVLRGKSFLKIAFEVFEKGGRRWNCKAGSWYYAISPDGRFCVCQDFDTDLFILNKAFEERLKSRETKREISKIRNGCSGCTYPCYLETQTLMTHPWELVPKGIAYFWWRARLAAIQRTTGQEGAVH